VKDNLKRQMHEVGRLLEDGEGTLKHHYKQERFSWEVGAPYKERKPKLYEKVKKS